MSTVTALLRQHNVHPLLGAIGEVPTPDEMLAQMQGKTVTAGWDAVCALALGQVNTYFLDTWLSGGPVAPARHLATVVKVFSNISYEFDLQLGPPLIQFDLENQVRAQRDRGQGRAAGQPRADGPAPSLGTSEQTCVVSMLITGGAIRVRESVAGQVVYLATLTMPPNTALITGTVPLQQVTGVVKNGHDARLDFTKGAYTAKVPGVTPFINQILSPAIGAYFSSVPFTYTLGTVIYDDTTSVPTLVPSDFHCTIQKDTNGNECLLLLIKTNGSGSDTSEIDFMNGLVPIPAGHSSALIVSSRALHDQGGVLMHQYADFAALKSLGGAMQPVKPADLTKAWSLTTTGGGLGVAKIDMSMKTSLVWYVDAFTVPLSPLQIASSGNTLVSSWNVDWNPTVHYEIEAGNIPAWTSDKPRMHGTLSNNAWDLSITSVSKDGQTAQKIAMSANPTPVVTFPTDQSSDWLKKAFAVAGGSGAVQDACNAAVSEITGPIRELFKVQLEPVSVMALENLLFGSNAVMWLQQAYAPGDMAVFGTMKVPVQVSPAHASVEAGGQLTFQAVVIDADPSGISWSVTGLTPGLVRPGTIDPASGVYRAPPTIPANGLAVVTANLPSGAYGQALVALNAPVTVQPAAAVVTASQEVDFGAVLANGTGSVKWSLSPPSPSLGSIDPNTGSYTAPDTISAPATVTIIATATAPPTQTGKATVQLVQSISVPLPAPIGVPQVKWWAQKTPRQPNWVRGNQVRYAVSFYDAQGVETPLSPWMPWVPIGDYALPYLMGVPTDPFQRAHGRRVYRQFTADAQKNTQFRIAEIADNTTTECQDEWD